MDLYAMIKAHAQSLFGPLGCFYFVKKEIIRYRKRKCAKNMFILFSCHQIDNKKRECNYSQT